VNKFGQFTREEAIQKLKKFDEEIYNLYPELVGKVDVIIAGSTTQMQYLDNFRWTYDIDILKSNFIFKDLMEKYSMNTEIQNIADYNIPYDYEERIQRLDFGFKAVNFYVVSLEDFIVMKLMAYRPKDVIDLSNKELIKQINWNILDELILKMDEVFLNDRIKNEFHYLYKNFKEENH